jgi:hypothetical protein
MVTTVDGVVLMSIQNNGCALWLSNIFYNVWVSLSVSMTDFPVRSWVGGVQQFWKEKV